MPIESRFPALQRPLPLAIAHRGGSWEAPENTALAFDRAQALGFTYLETDVRATADGQAVVFHDHHLDRVSTAIGKIREHPWSVVRTARIHGHQPILRLADLLDRYPDVVFNLDIKEKAAIDPFITVVRQHKAVDRVVAASFSLRRLAAVRDALGPRLASSLAPQEILSLHRKATGRRPWTPIPRGAACVQVPMRVARRPLVTSRFVHVAHSRGLQVHVWTIDSPDDMNDLLDLDVDGIMTDRPSVLRDTYRARGLWPHDSSAS